MLCLSYFQREKEIVADEYSLAEAFERFYQNQLALEAALMELTL